MEMMNLWALVVSKESPVLEPTVKPEKVMDPAAVPLVNKISIAQSEDGAAKVKAPLPEIY